MNEARFARPAHLDEIELVSVNYRERSFPKHLHDCFVVGTVVTGAEALEVRSETYVVRTGDVLRLNPREPHANRTMGTGPLRYRVFYLPEASVMRFLGGDRACSFREPVISDARLGAALATLHSKLFDDQLGQLEQECALAEVVAAVWTGTEGALGRPVYNNAGLSRARQFIEQYFALDFGLVELAALAGLSVFRFAHLFKSTTGLSPIAYRNQCRVDAAKRLLRAGQPIATIASDLGFADQSHLTRHFQRIVGTSPNRYRQQ